MPARRRTRSAQGSLPAAARRGAKTLGGGKSRPASKRTAAALGNAAKDRARRRTRPATGSAIAYGAPRGPATGRRTSQARGRRTRPATGSAIAYGAPRGPAKLGARAMPSAVQKSRDISATKRRQRQAQQLKKFRAALGTGAKDRARRRAPARRRRG